MKTLMLTLFALALLTPSAQARPKIQNQDVKSVSDVVGAGGSAADTIHDSKIYVTANGINQQLDYAIAHGLIGGGGATGGSAPGSVNMLVNNPGFESGTSGWTASAGTFSTTSTAANVGVGVLAGSWVTGGGARTLSSTLSAIPAGLYGQPAIAYCRLQTVASDFQLAVNDGTSNVAGPMTIQGAGASQYALYMLDFTMPSSGSLKLVLTSASSQTVYIDDCFIGSPVNTHTVTSEIYVYGVNSTSAGYGSTNTMIRIYNTVGKSTGSAITRSSSSTAGDAYTINEPGLYSIAVSEYCGLGNCHVGISVNSSQLSTEIGSINAANSLCGGYGAAGFSFSCPVTTYLNKGDVVRPHMAADSTSGGATTFQWFRIAKIRD